MNLAEYKGVYVFAQQVDNQISSIALELIGKGKDLAKDLGTTVTAVLVGSNVKGLADELGEYGADKVIVVDDPEVLHKMYQANGVPAKPLLECAFAILICGDYSKAFKFSKDYFAVDGSIAGQNMILAAWSLGIGSVWLGTWPQMDRVFAQSKLFDLPNDQIPHSIIAFGYPLDEIKEKEEYYDEAVVHYNKW